MVQKQPKKQLYKIRTFASDQSGVNPSAKDNNSEPKKAPTLKAEMSKTINEISKLDTADLISSPSIKTSSKKVIKENIIDESVVTPVRDDLPVSKSKIDIEISNDDSEVATIITDTKKDRFKLFPAISASIQKWFGDYKKNRELKKAPKYTVPETARRKGIIQKATSQTGIGATSDFNSIRERVRQRQEQEEMVNKKAKAENQTDKNLEEKIYKKHLKEDIETESSKEVAEKTPLQKPTISIPKPEVVIKHKNDKKTTKPNWETATIREKEEKSKTIWTPKVEPAFPLLEKELTRNEAKISKEVAKTDIPKEVAEKTPLQKPTLEFTQAKDTLEEKKTRSGQVSSPVIRVSLGNKKVENNIKSSFEKPIVEKSAPASTFSPNKETKPVSGFARNISKPTTFNQDLNRETFIKGKEKEKEVTLTKNEVEKPLFSTAFKSPEKDSSEQKSNFFDFEKDKVANTSVSAKDIKVSGFSGFERGVRVKKDATSEKNEEKTVSAAEEKPLPKRVVTLETPKTKNKDLESVVFREGKVKKQSSLNLFGNLDTNSLALSIAVLIVILSGSIFFITEKNRKNAVVVETEMVTINPHLFNGEFVVKNGEVSYKEDLVTIIKQEFELPKNNLAYFAFGTPDKINYIKPSAILLLLDFNLETNFSQSVSNILFGSLPEGEPFLVLDLVSYKSAFGGMLSWEKNIYKDLEEIFSLEEDYELGDFIDASIGSESVRILKNDVGDEKLVYSIVNERFVIITTNTISLREIIKDLNY